MRVTLVTMPWQALNSPSLPIGLLRSRLRVTRPDDDVAEYHGSIRFAEYLLAETGGELGPPDYWRVADEGIFHGVGEWIFAGTLYDDPHRTVPEFGEYAAAQGLRIDSVLRMRKLADGFVDLAVDEVLATEPDVVGITTTFMQNVPSLALARRVKRRAPDIRIILGGGNCDGPMGAALHRNHRFVDHVVRGEGELVLPELLDRIEHRKPVADVPGLCWWDDDRSMTNPQATEPVPPSVIPVPDFDAWFAAIEGSPVRRYQHSLYLVVEGARGCWWGEKHQCTFCGLNGSMMAFRNKSVDQFWHELAHLVERHRVLDVITVDNILGMDYLRTLLPRIAETGWDLRIFYEIKSNMRAQQVATLARAGVVLVQPGIESLSGRVLRLMAKGVDGVTNVRLLRDCESQHVTVQWNYLYGFPGEDWADYRNVIDQVPALVHLQAPTIVTRIVVERFSPYYERPELGLPATEPLPFYRYVYDLPAEEQHDLAYFFESEPAGIRADQAGAFGEACRAWAAAYPASTLVSTIGPDGTLRVRDRRIGWPQRDILLTDWEADAYEELARGRTADSLSHRLDERGHTISAERLGAWLDEMLTAGLVFTDAGSWVALATTDATLPVTPRTAS